MSKKTRDLRDLLFRMDDYVIAPRGKEWLLGRHLPPLRGSRRKS